MRRRAGAGWRALGWFWVGVLVLFGGAALTLQVLGPPPAPPPPLSPSAPAAAPAPISPNDIAAPLPALLEPSKDFPPSMLPRIGPVGRAARLAYARPAPPASGRPRVALVVTGLGLSDGDSRSAIEALPGPVSLAFSPYAARPDALTQLCRVAGHEMLISIPMEPQGFPLNDAGSKSLLTGATPQQNEANLMWSLGRIQGYVGAVGAMEGLRGERFAAQFSSWKAMLDELARRGLLYVDPRPGKAADILAGIPGRVVDAIVDDPPARAEIEAKLAGLERTARETGSALGLAGPLRPVTVERIAAWAKGLDERGIDLVPASALINGTKP